MCVFLEFATLDNYIPGKEFEIKQDDKIIDIGAHIGSFSILASKKAIKGKVFSYEPSPQNFDQLLKNLKLNNINNAKVINKAIAAKKGKIRLYLDNLNTAMNSINVKTKNYVDIDSISLKDVFMRNKIKKCNFLKMDCEGAEYEILLNTKKQTFNMIDKIVCEYHEPKYFGIKEKAYNPKNLIKHLKENGFDVRIKKINFYQGMLYAIR